MLQIDLVAAIAVEDWKISLSRKNRQSRGTIPVAGTDKADNFEAVTSLCWQRSKPVLWNKNCIDETELLGGAIEDSIPFVTSSSASSYTDIAGSRNLGRSSLSLESSSLLTSSVSMYNSLGSSTVEETPLRSSLLTGGTLARLRPTRAHNYKDDMDVFSPLVDVQPITPSVDKLWDEHGGARKDLLVDKKSSLLFSSSRRFPLSQEGGNVVHPIFDWKPSSTSKQDDSQFLQQPSSNPAASSKTDDASSITPPEAWGGERISDKLAHHRQSVNLPSKFTTLASSSSSSFSGSQDLAPSTSSTLTNLRHRDISESDTPLFVHEQTALTLPRRLSTDAKRISTTPAFTDGTSLSTSSPKTKKTGAETREELLNSLLSRSDAVPAIGSEILSSANGGISQPQRMSSLPDLQQGSSFTLQLFQRSLEETLAPIQKAFRDDMRNLHIEVLRQAHTQQMEYSGTLSLILENQVEMMRRLELMEIAVQQLRQPL